MAIVHVPVKERSKSAIQEQLVAKNSTLPFLRNYGEAHDIQTSVASVVGGSVIGNGCRRLGTRKLHDRAQGVPEEKIVTSQLRNLSGRRRARTKLENHCSSRLRDRLLLATMLAVCSGRRN